MLLVLLLSLESWGWDGFFAPKMYSASSATSGLWHPFNTWLFTRKATPPLWPTLSLHCHHSDGTCHSPASIFSGISWPAEWNPRGQQGKRPPPPSEKLSGLLSQQSVFTPSGQAMLNHCCGQRPGWFMQLLPFPSETFLSIIKNRLRCFHLGGAFPESLSPTGQDWHLLLSAWHWAGWYNYRLYETKRHSAEGFYLIYLPILSSWYPCARMNEWISKGCSKLRRVSKGGSKEGRVNDMLPVGLKEGLGQMPNLWQRITRPRIPPLTISVFTLRSK